MKIWTTASGYTITRVIGGRCNVYLLSNGGKHILVDTNLSRYRHTLVRSLETLKIDRLDALVLTHTHFDHVENAAFIQKQYSAQVIVHVSEAEYLRRGNTPLPSGTILPTKILTSLISKRVQSHFAYEPCRADIQADDGFSLRSFGFNARLMHTPGQSCGMMSLIVENEIAFVGDAMMGVYPNSIFVPFAEDASQLVRSWGKLLDTECTLFLPGHGSPVGRVLVEKCYRRRVSQ
ncbi:MAG: MBL fold metallo-hydrolase [Ignavibacteriales bacterium]|nr:MBL fold metallo-hydrolase [Ignavibacteriales bacterium]